jgi:hypothetical protein
MTWQFALVLLVTYIVSSTVTALLIGRVIKRSK